MKKSLKMLTTRLISILLLSLDVTGIHGGNLALNKPAYQSSTYFVSSPTSVAENAVDGDTSRNWYSSSCAHTNDGENNPWWMVDLLARYQITNVTIWNRDIYTMTNLVVEVSSQNPRLCASPDTKQCTVFPGTLGPIQTLTCDTPVVGRFVNIRKGHEGPHVTFCEVDVRGNDLSNRCDVKVFNKAEGKRYQINSANSLVTMVTRIQCGSDCQRNNCIGFNYEISTGTCEMILKLTSQDQLVDNAGWVYYGEDVC